MKKAVVAEIVFMDNDLKQVYVELQDDATWKDAYAKAFIEDDSYKEWIESMNDDIGIARQEFFDSDMMISVLFID